MSQYVKQPHILAQVLIWNPVPACPIGDHILSIWGSIGHYQSNEHWNHFKGNVGETSERLAGWLFQGHRFHLEQNWTDRPYWYATLPFPIPLVALKPQNRTHQMTPHLLPPPPPQVITTGTILTNVHWHLLMIKIAMIMVVHLKIAMIMVVHLKIAMIMVVHLDFYFGLC